MKTVAMILALLVPAVLSADFDAWKAATGTSFHTIEEEAARRAIFNANVARINEHNAKDLGWTMGLNDFAAMTSEEFASAYIGGWKGPSRRVPSYDGKHLLANKVGLPTSVDWTTKGAVTPVKNQGQCGSCWAFSTTGSVEGITAIKTGQLISLSEQQLVDCSGAEGNMGCNGGLMDNAFKYIIQNGGICSESAYPYQGVQGTCQSSSCKSVATISGYTDVQPDSETALMSAIAQQPVSIAVEANQMSFQFYSGGVMTSSCGDQLDHGVLAVGYGSDSGSDFWKVKNSWGPSWGSNGYILLGRGGSYGNNGAGQCGLLTTPSYPTKN